MPYIKKERREELFDSEWANTPGELNYLITKLCLNYLEDPDAGNGGVQTYTKLNEIIGVLECAKQEFYRRVVASFEDRKRAENGDVYHE